MIKQKQLEEIASLKIKIGLTNKEFFELLEGGYKVKSPLWLNEKLADKLIKTLKLKTEAV